MRVKELKDLIQDTVSLIKDTGTGKFEIIYFGLLKDAPVRLLGMFVGNITSSAPNQIDILVY